MRLYGNPLALITAANCYLNRDNAGVNKVDRLSKVYEMMTDYTDKLSAVQKKRLKDMDPSKLNDFSLEIATRMTLGLLPINEDNSSAAKDLLFFIGCLPGGIRKTWLKKMWDSRSVEQDLPSLESFELVQKNENAQKGTTLIVKGIV